MKLLPTLALASALHTFQIVSAQTSSNGDLTPPPLPSPKPPTEFDLTLQKDAAGVKGLSIPHVGGAFWGFSIEMAAINEIVGKNSTSLNVPFLNLLANLQERAGSVLVRVGGRSQETAALVNSLPGDATTGFSNDTSHPTLTPPVLYTRDMFYLAGNVSSKLDVKWVFGIPFNQTGTTWRLAIAEEAETILGDKLAALQAGNEPDLYSRTAQKDLNYSPASFTNEVSDLVKAIDADNKLPVKNNLLGPNIVNVWSPEEVWKTGFVEKFKDRLRALTVQLYPTNNCAAQFGVGNPVDPQSVLPKFLSHKGIVDLVSPYLGSAALAQAANVPFMMSETNTASCGGFPGLSDSFTAALWGVDFGLQLAQANFSSGLLQAGDHNTSYNPFKAPAVDQSTPGWTIGPVYFSALVLAEAFGKTNTSCTVDITSNPNTPAYAIYEKDTLSKVALINYMDDATSASDLKVSLKLPTGIPGVLKVKHLSAKSVTSRDGISWAGQSFGNASQSDGRLQGDLDVETITCDIPNKSCVVHVPAPGFALVFFDTATPEVDIGQATQTFATTQGLQATSSGSGASKPTSAGFSVSASRCMGGVLSAIVGLIALMSFAS